MSEEPIFIWPSAHAGPQTSGFDLLTLNLHSVAPLTNDIIPGGTIDQRFVFTPTFPPKSNLDGREQSGLIARLRGMRGRVRMRDPLRRLPAFNLKVLQSQEDFSDGTNWDDGTGWVEGFLPSFVTVLAPASRGDRSLLLGGFPASTPEVLTMGDLGEVRPNGVMCSHAHLYETTFVSASDADGHTLWQFEPGLRAGVAAGDQLVLRDPMTVFQLASDAEGRASRDVHGHWRMGLTLVEVPVPPPGREFGT
jgi:hypothetical protein